MYRRKAEIQEMLLLLHTLHSSSKYALTAMQMFFILSSLIFVREVHITNTKCNENQKLEKNIKYKEKFGEVQLHCQQVQTAWNSCSVSFPMND
jgi:uncharacterized membrane protein